MMDQMTAVPRQRAQGSNRRGGVVCPSLVLATRVVCDRFGPLHEPGRLHVLAFCTTAEHLRCTRWLIDRQGQAAAGGSPRLPARDIAGRSR